MALETIALAFVGLAVCCFGFFRRPNGSLELISARFVIPVMVASATFAEVLWHATQDEVVNVYELARVDAGTFAVAFVIVCLICFWIGYWLPVGRIICRPFMSLGIPITPTRSLATGAHVLCCLLLLIYLLDLLLPEVMMPIPGRQVFTMVLMFVAAVLLGLSFPEKSQRGPLDTPLLVIWILVVSLPLMSTFSRGAGIPALAAAAAYSVRRGKLNVLGISLAVAWAIISTQVAFGGRATVGHYAGVIAWFGYLFSGECWAGIGSAFDSAMHANDSFTPLCVSMRAIQTTEVFAMTPMDWILFQIPLPHIFAFSPRYTLDLTFYVGGNGSWGYTPGLFGDIFVHVGWMGAMIFVGIGWIYRAIDELAFSPTPEGTLNPFFLLAVFGYMAMAVGLFNNFRSWNTALVDGFCLVCGLLFLRKTLRPSDWYQQGHTQTAAHEMAATSAEWRGGYY